jgi:membrane fusion protein (multidrug efflux system)
MNTQKKTTPSPPEASAKSRKSLGFIFASLAAVALLLTACTPTEGNEDKENTRPPPPAKVRFIEVERRTVDRLNQLPGRVVAYEVAEIRPQVSGIIQSRLFDQGAYVEEGQQLYQIDPARYEADYQMAQASLEDAQARRKNAATLAERNERLIQTGAVSQQQYDDAVAELNRSKAAVSMAEAEIRMAEINLEYTKVRAPISGFIGPSSVTRGALVTERQAMPLATVRQLNPVYVDLSQSATAAQELRDRLTAARISEDEAEQFAVTLYPVSGDEPYPEKGELDVAELAVDPQTGAIRLRSTFPNPDKRLLPGMFVRAAIDEGASSAVITIPQKSATLLPDGQRSVWIIDTEDRAQKRTIHTGAPFSDQWVVLDGLEPGERLIVEGVMRLSEGAAVQAEAIEPAE